MAMIPVSRESLITPRYAPQVAQKETGPQRWQEAGRLFEEAVGLPESERETFLDDQRVDRELRQIVERLLWADQSSGSFLEPPGEDQEGPDSVARKAIGSHIGPYRILDLIAEGGMGSVYRAERADDAFERQVAIKLTRRVFAGSHEVARFRVEREIHARLEHPNIARLLDGGTTEEGRPYLVMEYVEGGPIDRYCKARQLNLIARIRLFQQVCSAVEYAHRNLMIHRDLKPDNILVTPEGTVKLLDFGIAKLLSSDSLPSSVPATQTGQRPMSIGYASPEQIRGQLLSTSSDIFVLGILLYELAAECSPFADEQALPHEIEQAICDGRVVPPSARLTNRRNTSTGADSLGQRQQPRGDLDHIVLKALRKEPQNRYGSVTQFSDDLERYLADLPVLARHGSLSYRCGKFVRRHRLALTALGVLSVLVVIFVVTLMRQARDLRIERWRVVEQAREVELERDRKEKSLEFLVDVFRASDPHKAQQELTAREILEAGAKRVIGDLDGEDEIQATLLDAIGRVYVGLGLYEEAEPRLEQAVEMRRRLHGPKHADLATSLHHLAELRHEMGEYETAESLFRESLSLRRELFGNDDLAVAETLNGLATLLRWSGQLDGAQGIHEEALAIRQRILGLSHPDVAQSLDSLASLFFRLGDYDRAVDHYRQAVEIQRRELGTDHPATAMSQKNLGLALGSRGDLDESARLISASFRSLKKSLGEDHNWTLQSGLNLIWVRLRKGDFLGAEALARENLELQLRRLERSHPDVLIGRFYLYFSLRNLDRYPEIEKALPELITDFRQRFGNDHLMLTLPLNLLGQLRFLQNRLAESEQALRESLEILDRANAEDPIVSMSSMHYLGKIALERGDLVTAEIWLKKALGLAGEKFHGYDWQIADTSFSLGLCMIRLKREDEAAEFFKQSRDVFLELFGSDDPRTRRSQEQLDQMRGSR